MLSSLTVCLLFLQASSIAGYGAKAQPQMFPQPNIYPETGVVFPMMQLGSQGRYQHFAPFIPAQPMWENMRMQPMPFFHPLDCDIPSHQNMHMMGSSFVHQNQWTGIPFQGQGQWGQTAFPNQGQGQWTQSLFPNQGKGQWKQTAFLNRGKGQIKQTGISNQGQGQWKQPTSWNIDENVRMVGQWEGFPVNDQMLSQPAVSGLAPKETGFQPETFIQPQTGSQSFGTNGFDVPVQSRRLR